MPNFSDYAEQSILNHIYRTDTFSKPSTIAIALTSDIPTDGQTGATINEIADSNGYARKTYGQSDANWSLTQVNGSGTLYNNAVVEFDVATSAWGHVSGIVTVDSATHGAGNVIHRGVLNIPKFVDENEQLVIPISGIQISLS